MGEINGTLKAPNVFEGTPAQAVAATATLYVFFVLV